jgi:PAS domain S-box-containing protein
MRISEETINDFLSFLPAILYEYVLYEDGSGEFLYMSHASKEMLEQPPEYFIQDVNRMWQMIHPDDTDRLKYDDEKANKENEFFISEVRVNLSSGKEKWIQFSSKPTKRKKNDSYIWIGYIIDITDRKKMEAEIKTLQGIIPICSYCHSIRDDKGAWDEIEAYLSKYSDAKFSHGICPNCIDKVREDAGLDKKN